MKNTSLLLALMGLLVTSFQANCMKRTNSGDLTNHRQLKKAQPELKENNNRLVRGDTSPRMKHRSNQKMRSLTSPQNSAFKATQETIDAQRTHEAQIEAYNEIYNEFYRQYQLSCQEDLPLTHQFFVELEYCKNSTPSNLIKHKRAFDQLLHRAESRRLPAQEVAQEEELPLTVPLEDSELGSE